MNGTTVSWTLCSLSNVDRLLVMKTFLHVGCGSSHKDRTTAGFNTTEWQELRFDIDQSVSPDLVGTMTDMSSVQTESVDAIYSSHNIEHLYGRSQCVPRSRDRFLPQPRQFASPRLLGNDPEREIWPPSQVWPRISEPRAKGLNSAPNLTPSAPRSQQALQMA